MIPRLTKVFALAAALATAVFLAACAPVEAPRLGTGPPVITPKQAKALGTAQDRQAVTTFVLEPLANAPADQRFAFEDKLKELAPTRQMKIAVGDNDPAATYRLKGYLSAVGDYNSTLIIYVLDVFDRSGVRVHRISGQLTAAGSSADPWASIKETGKVEQAAQDAIDALGNWVRAGQPALPRAPS